jgi:GntR family transcriptional regulator
MAHYLKVNPNTIMRSYQELEREKLIETRRGQGTYVTQSSEKVDEIKHNMASEAINTFIDSMKKLGIDRKTAESFLEEADWK